jgi:hypothetical protein
MNDWFLREQIASGQRVSFVACLFLAFWGVLSFSLFFLQLAVRGESKIARLPRSGSI